MMVLWPDDADDTGVVGTAAHAAARVVMLLLLVVVAMACKAVMVKVINPNINNHNPQLYTALHPKPSIPKTLLNPKPQILNPKPQAIHMYIYIYIR